MIVALWRVALYGTFLWRYAGLRHSSFIAALLAPLAIILFALVALNLENAIFEIMAGIERERTPDQEMSDSRFMVVNLLFVFSLITVPIWVMAYGKGLYDKRKADLQKRIDLNLQKAQGGRPLPPPLSEDNR